MSKEGAVMMLLQEGSLHCGRAPNSMPMGQPGGPDAGSQALAPPPATGSPRPCRAQQQLQPAAEPHVPAASPLLPGSPMDDVLSTLPWSPWTDEQAVGQDPLQWLLPGLPSGWGLSPLASPGWRA
jgi:hypothetical protein